MLTEYFELYWPPLPSRVLQIDILSQFAAMIYLSWLDINGLNHADITPGVCRNLRINMAQLYDSDQV